MKNQINGQAKGLASNELINLASEHMKTEIISISAETSIEKALMIMKNHNFRHLPVTEIASKKIIGIVSDRDLYKALSSEEIQVGQILSHPLLMCEVTAPVSEIIEIMIKNKISAVLLKKNSEVKGIITTEDLLVILSQALSEETKMKSFMDSYLEYTNQMTGVSFNPNLIT